MFVENVENIDWSSVGTAYFYFVPTELGQYLANPPTNIPFLTELKNSQTAF
ncbi:hypothetical protein BH20ACI1_BH20ACI1_27330 [soil metagenome]